MLLINVWYVVSLAGFVSVQLYNYRNGPGVIFTFQSKIVQLKLMFLKIVFSLHS